jgi:hypothetical protein
MPRRKYVLAPFSRGILVYTASTCFVAGRRKIISGNKDKTKMPRRKYVLAPFSRGILFFTPFSRSIFINTVNRIEAKRPICSWKMKRPEAESFR